MESSFLNISYKHTFHNDSQLRYWAVGYSEEQTVGRVCTMNEKEISRTELY
jgi:hypothetical protein